MQSVSQNIRAVEDKRAHPIIFKAVSSANSNLTVNANDYLPFNSLVFSYPDAASYDTINYSYTVPVNGIYQFSYRLYVNSSSTLNGKIAFLKNNTTIAITGNLGANIESLTALESCNAGDVIRVRCLIGNGLIFWMNPVHCSFSGQLIYEL